MTLTLSIYSKLLPQKHGMILLTITRDHARSILALTFYYSDRKLLGSLFASITMCLYSNMSMTLSTVLQLH